MHFFFDYPGGIRVPALISGGKLPLSMRGKKTEELFHITDIYATICTQSGSNCDDLSLNGRDLTDLIEDRQTQSNLNINNVPHERSIIINVNNYQCSSSWNGRTICGAIIKQTSSGIFKAVIGNDIAGTDAKYAWNQLHTQSRQGLPTVQCNGNQPNFNARFRRNNCATLRRVCLFNLSNDPCEYSDLSGNGAYQDILIELMEELLIEYVFQTQTFISYCPISRIGSNLAKRIGYYKPWAEDYFSDSQYSIDNDKGLIDACPV